MIVFEPREHIEVKTCKGTGRIWLVTEYGSEIEKIFTVIINKTGEVWEFKNKDVTITGNNTMGGYDDKTH